MAKATAVVLFQIYGSAGMPIGLKETRVQLLRLFGVKYSAGAGTTKDPASRTFHLSGNFGVSPEFPVPLIEEVHSLEKRFTN